MKTKYFLLLLALCLFSLNMSSQETDIFGALKKSAELYNEQNGDNENNSNNSSAQSQQEAEDWWNQELDENAGILSGLTDKNEKCIAMILLWAHGYQSVRNEREEAVACKRKYDLYGMEILALTSGNFIMYCTEDLYNMGEHALGDIALGFYNNYFDNIDDYLYNDTNVELMYDGYGNKAAFAKKIHWILDNWEDYEMKNSNTSHSTSLVLGAYLIDIIDYLEPVEFLRRTAAIGEAMDALGCGG